MPQPKRNWRSYAEAREFVRSLHIPKQQAYEAWSKSGARPDDIPGSPKRAYGAEWQGWADFLGNNGAKPRRVCASGEYLPFEEARAHIRKLGLQTQNEYREWAKTEDRPVGIPAGPYNIYGDEWTNWSDFLGARGFNGYRSFEEARDYAREKQFKSRQDWADHANSHEFPHDLPIYPEYAYRDDGWIDWPNWLGIEGKLTRPRILAILNSIKEIMALRQTKCAWYELGFSR